MKPQSPNMALQRTRRPRIRSGRSLRSLGSPLNALPLGATLKAALLGLLGCQLSAAGAAASPAVRLSVYVPSCVGVCPGTVPPLTAVTPGQIFGISVVAVDSSEMIDSNYSGTLTFSSTDPLATLPSNYTVSPQDMGGHFFTNAFALRTPGVQTITVSDSAGSLVPAVATITVFGPAVPASIPLLSGTSLFALASLLAVSGAAILWSKG